MSIDLTKITDVEIEYVGEHPEWSDSFIMSAKYNGVEMTEEEIENLNENHHDFVGKCVHE